ncbi:MAG: M16 family metallopeptidase [Bacillota bacterium]|jgi:predicted Zn-dependent peptidase
MTYRDILPNGIKVITEPLDHLHSVTTGVWSTVGSVYEREQFAGVSHFLEHMMFKGTPTRSSREISETLDAVGGQLNAFTSKEHTCYYAKCLAEDFALSLDLLSDMYLHSTFDEQEFLKEQKVILEEIKMYQDSPDDVASEQMIRHLWAQHPYGRPIIGSEKSVGEMNRDDLYRYYLQQYRPHQTIISVAGNVTHQQVLQEVKRCFGDFQGESNSTPLPQLTAHGGQAYTYRDIEQTHLCLGVPGLHETHADFSAATLLSAALGGGASSRLFQEAREKRGLAYAIYSYHCGYLLGGYFLSYASTRPQNVQEIVPVILEQMAEIREKGVTEEELQRLKQQFKGSMLLGLENTSNVMNRLARMEMIWGRLRSVEESVAALLAVTTNDIKRVAGELFQADKVILSLVGKKEKTFDFKQYI